MERSSLSFCFFLNRLWGNTCVYVALTNLLRQTVCNISQLQTVCRSRLRPAPPDAHSPSAFPTEWRHESTGEHAPSSRCAQPRVSGYNPGIRPSSGILGTRLRTPGRWLRPLFPCIRREGSAAGRLLRCGRHKGTNLAPPRCMLFPSRTRSCLFYKYSSTQD